MQYLDAELTNAVDYGTTGALVGAGTLPQSLDGSATLEADDWGYGFNIGFLVEPTEISTLRFFLRPSDVSLAAIGFSGPRPNDFILAGAIPWPAK